MAVSYHEAKKVETQLQEQVDRASTAAIAPGGPEGP